MNIVSSRTLFIRQTDRQTDERTFAFLELLTEPTNTQLLKLMMNNEYVDFENKILETYENKLYCASCIKLLYFDNASLRTI